MTAQHRAIPSQIHRRGPSMNTPTNAHDPDSNKAKTLLMRSPTGTFVDTQTLNP